MKLCLAQYETGGLCMLVESSFAGFGLGLSTCEPGEIKTRP